MLLRNRKDVVTKRLVATWDTANLIMLSKNHMGYSAHGVMTGTLQNMQNLLASNGLQVEFGRIAKANGGYAVDVRIPKQIEPQTVNMMQQMFNGNDQLKVGNGQFIYWYVPSMKFIK